MSKNSRRQSCTDSSFEETGDESQMNSFKVLAQIPNLMLSVIEKLDNIATLTKDTNLGLHSKEILNDSRTCPDNQQHATTTRQQRLKSTIKNRRDTLNERRKMFWLYLKMIKLSETFKEWYCSTQEIKLNNFKLK